MSARHSQTTKTKAQKAQLQAKMDEELRRKKMTTTSAAVTTKLETQRVFKPTASITQEMLDCWVERCLRMLAGTEEWGEVKKRADEKPELTKMKEGEAGRGGEG